MSPEELACATEALRRILDEDLVHLLEPRLHADHAPLVEAIGHLPWETGPLDAVADEAVKMLTLATRAGGPVDPATECSDVAWALAVNRMLSAPAIGSRSARRWFVHGDALLSNDVPVCSLFQATASYYVAAFEDARNREHERWWWMQMASGQTEIDARPGLGLVAVLRFARLLSGRFP
jgi:hypothetical protein